MFSSVVNIEIVAGGILRGLDIAHGVSSRAQVPGRACAGAALLSAGALAPSRRLWPPSLRSYSSRMVGKSTTQAGAYKKIRASVARCPRTPLMPARA